MQVRVGTPRNPLEWLAAILIFGVMLALGFMLMGVVIVVVAIALVAAPIITWWRGKKGLAQRPAQMRGPPVGPSQRPPPGPSPIDDEQDGPIVDAEFHVKDD